MERLTYVTEEGEVLFHPAELPDDEGVTITQLAKAGRYKELKQIAERLANREQAEENGLLLRLPCKVGDSYILIFNDFGELFTTIGWELTEITIVEDDIILDFYCHVTTEDEQRSINSFGKTIFKTKEEAEAKLAEMEGSHDEKTHS